MTTKTIETSAITQVSVLEIHERKEQIAGRLAPFTVYLNEAQQISVTGGAETETTQDLLSRFSRLKYGSLAEAEYFAQHICQSALSNASFVAFLERARDENALVYITSPGIYNVPSASNLLLKAVTAHLNVALSQSSNLPTVIYTDQTRVGESSLHYASQSLGQRGSEKRSRSITPEKFNDQFVIFVDDVVISGTVANRAAQSILAVGAQELFQLFAAQVDPLFVAQTYGKIEDVINRYQITGSLESLKPILLGEFEPVQKLLRDFLCPENTHYLFDFLQTLPNQVVLKIFRAATANDFFRRYNEIYRPSLELVLNHLQSIGLADERGYLTLIG